MAGGWPIDRESFIEGWVAARDAHGHLNARAEAEEGWRMAFGTDDPVVANPSPFLPAIRSVLGAYRSSSAHVTEEQITAAWEEYDRLRQVIAESRRQIMDWAVALNNALWREEQRR